MWWKFQKLTSTQPPSIQDSSWCSPRPFYIRDPCKPWIGQPYAVMSPVQFQLMLMLLLLSCFSCVRLCAMPQTAAHPGYPRPRDSPGKNTGVGCRFLLQCMKVKSESEVTQSCPTLSDPMDCRLPGSSVHGIFQARVLEWVAVAFSN